MRRLDTIIIHHSLSKTATVEEIRQWHRARGFKDIGYHYVIQPDGLVEIGRPIEQIGAHAKGRNTHSIGVCLVGNFDKKRPTLRQYGSLTSLVDSLRLSYGALQVEYHHETCPGKLFNRSFLC